jgi:HSP20 family protein
MNLARWEPFEEWTHFPFPHLTPFFDLRPTIPSLAEPATCPGWTSVVAKCELPRLDSHDDVDISVDEASVTISGQFKRGESSRAENYVHSERYYGSFSRTLPLPARVKPEEARATYRNGILTVHMPKSEGERRHRIKIEVQH